MGAYPYVGDATQGLVGVLYTSRTLTGARTELLSLHDGNERGARWSLDEFPATRYVLDHRLPGQVVVGDDDLSGGVGLAGGHDLFLPRAGLPR